MPMDGEAMEAGRAMGKGNNDEGRSRLIGIALRIVGPYIRPSQPTAVFSCGTWEGSAVSAVGVPDGNGSRCCSRRDG